MEISKALASTEYWRFPGGRKKIAVLLGEVERLGHERPRVLDVGCGNGALAFPLAAVGCEVVGVDADAGSIEMCRRRCGPLNARFEIAKSDLSDIEGVFDLVVCSEVLEHLRDPRPLVAAMAAKLAPEGRVFVTVPNGYGLREIGGRLERRLRERCGLDAAFRGIRRVLARIGMPSEREKYRMHTANPEQAHVQKFTRRSLVRLLGLAGLEVCGWRNSFVILSVFSCRDGTSLIERIDEWAADHLPSACASGWYVTCRHGAPPAAAGPGAYPARASARC